VRNDDVIPLSRFRAALARARRGRRADALIAEPDAARLVPQLPVQELYYAIQEVGLADATELLALASPEQVQGLVDLDVWERDQLDVARLQPWLDALVDAGPLKLAAAVEALDGEVIALALQRQAHVYDLQLDQVPEEPEGHFYPTPDRFFMLDVIVDAERGKAVERMIDWLYRADLELARRVIMSARWELPSDLEEHAYRWRSGRMADLGFVDFYEALAIYRYLDPATVTVGEKSAGHEAAAPAAASTLPVQLAGALDETSFFARALAVLADPEPLQAPLLTLVNQALAADRVEPGDVDAARDVLGRVVGYLGMGLETLGRGDPARAAEALETVALVRVFRVGFSLTLQLRRLADTLVRNELVQVTTVPTLLLEPPLDAAMEALRRARPLYPRELDDPAGTGPRPFRALDDVRRAAAALEEAALAGAFVFDGLGLPRAALATAVTDGTVEPSALRLGTLVRTAALHVLAGRAPSLEPLEARALPPIGPDARARIDAGFAARLAERGRAAPAALPRWLDHWLADLPAAPARPGGAFLRLVR
jgi:hypothetical protein